MILKLIIFGIIWFAFGIFVGTRFSIINFNFPDDFTKEEIDKLSKMISTETDLVEKLLDRKNEEQ